MTGMRAAMRTTGEDARQGSAPAQHEPGERRDAEDGDGRGFAAEALADVDQHVRGMEAVPLAIVRLAHSETLPIVCRIDTVDELEYFRNGGILQYVLRDLAA